MKILKNPNLFNEILSLEPDELIELKGRIITNVDKKKHAKDVLSTLSHEDARKTIDWIRKRYGV